MKWRMLLVAALAVAPVAVPVAAGAQECADDDYSASCRAQRNCEKTHDTLHGISPVLGQLVSCTQ